ncbi:MAG: glycosyltransferase family 1 protein [Xanthomonadaceae bacterium]|nr:glycosyltransferase family 1 protein [Xanthomonadaceae bacterium]
MRYAIVSETYPPDVNGVALTVQSLEQGLIDRGHDTTVIRPRQRDERTTERREHLMPSLPLPRYPGLRFGLPAARRLQAIWRSQRPDAIYVATEGPLGWAALRAARKLGIPTASGFHTRFDDYMRDYGVPFLQGTALRWMRHFHNLADATLVPTVELRDFLEANGFAHVLRLARAVDTDLFRPERRDAALRAQWGLGEHDLAVIHLGRIAAEKNLDLAIRSFREINARHPTACFVWVGDGPERARIERENPDFVFCGIQREQALGRHFASADLFLFPSLSETYGNVTLEALASGVPTVAFDYGAARERLRSGENGAAIAESSDARTNATAFVGAAMKIADDTALRSRMRAAARESVVALEPSQVAADFDRILSTLGQTRRTHERYASAA